MEEYIIVSDNNDILLPDTPSPQKRKKSLTIPARFLLNAEIKAEENNDKVENLKSNTSLSQESLSNTEATQKQLCPRIRFASMDITDQSSSHHNIVAENITHPPESSSYVDIQRHNNIIEVDVKQVDYSKVKEGTGDRILIVEREDAPGYMDILKQGESIPEDYSRVKEVHSDNTVILQKQNASADSSFREKGKHYTDCTNEKLTNTYVLTPSEVGEGTELSSGYVETVPAPPLMMLFNAVSTCK